MQVSIVIPTCNRKARLISLLQYLHVSTYAIQEIIIVDSSEELLSEQELSEFKNFTVRYIQSERSVCIQRNTGIREANSEWILLCDDDIEIAPDYLQKLESHIELHPEAGAVSGLWLQKEKGEWKATYPENSAIRLCWKYIFKLSIWGEIKCSCPNFIKQYYSRKGNHISKAGWPIVTDFSANYFKTPIYSLGAALVKREWLLNSPFDEVLDPHGIGDNYGVAMGFTEKIHVLNNVFVHHHQEIENRLQRPLQYYRRTLALDYFIRTKNVTGVKIRWLLWSLFGNMINFLFSGNRLMIRAGFKVVWMVLWNKNPYTKAAKERKKIIVPAL